MLKKIVIALAIFALAASAGSIPLKINSFTINLMQPATVQGQELKAGEYRLTINGEKMTFVKGKVTVEVPVKVEQVEQKFDTTSVRYTGTEKMQITEIRVGGTKTKLVFSN
jgi:hypothetical protein